MPDSPDFAKFNPGSVRFSLQDMGELAARLGSPAVYDRRGEVIFWDLMDNGISSWLTSFSGANAYARLSADKPFRHPYTLELGAGTTLSKYAIASRYISVFDSDKYGIELELAIPTNFDHIAVIIDGNVRDTAFEAGYLFTKATGKLQYENPSGGFTDLQTVDSISYGQVVYIPIKLVIDTNTFEYKRLLWGGVEYPLSGISFQHEDDPQQSYMAVIIQFYGVAAPQSICKVAQLIITANEP